MAQEGVYSNPQIPYGQQPPPIQQQQYGQPQNIPSQFNPPAENIQPVQSARIAEPEKPKRPIPEEHIHLKTVLEEVREQCYNNAKNPVKYALTGELITIRIKMNQILTLFIFLLSANKTED